MHLIAWVMYAIYMTLVNDTSLLVLKHSPLPNEVVMSLLGIICISFCCF